MRDEVQSEVRYIERLGVRRDDVAVEAMAQLTRFVVRKQMLPREAAALSFELADAFMFEMDAREKGIFKGHTKAVKP
jgi:hypothetical protein